MIANLPEYDWVNPITGYSYQELPATTAPLDIGYTTAVEVTAPEWPWWKVWLTVGIVAGIIFLPGRKKGGPQSNPPFYSRKHPQKVKGYYAHSYYRRKRRQ